MQWLEKLLFKIFHIHDWYHGCFTMNELGVDGKYHGIRSKYTNDYIGRSERHCKDCNMKQIHISQFSFINRAKIEIVFGKKKWYTFKNNDWLDLTTKEWLTKDTKS